MYYFLMFIVCIHLLPFFILYPSNTPLTIGHNNCLSLRFESIPAFFGSGYVAPANFQNSNMNKGRWTQGKHMIFMQEYEKYGNDYMWEIFFHRCEVGGRIFIPPNLHLHSCCFCWVRCRHCSDYDGRAASGNYEARGAKWRGITKLE
jgi:hypothetical protein